MIANRINKKPSASSYLLKTVSLASLLIATSLQLAAQGFGTITPGGVQPNLDRQLPPKATEKPDYDIPALPDRPLDEKSGPKIQVNYFQLEGVEDIPAANLSQRDINNLLDKIIAKQPEGFTIGQLQAVADLVTQYCRQRGLILSLAIIPEQEIKDGTVTITVLPGYLGSIDTVNNEYYSNRLLHKPLEPLLNKPVQVSEMESALLKLNDTPGLEVGGIFRPGKEVGETELVLNTKQESPTQFALFADNHGVDTTGQQRLIASGSWNNPLGVGDQLNITVLQTFDPEDSTYGAANYETPLFVPEFHVGLGYSLNDYVIAQSLQEGRPKVDGETSIWSAYANYQHVRSRRLNIKSIFDISTKQAELELPLFDEQGEDKLTVISIGTDIEVLDNWLGGGINDISVFYHQGLPDFLGSMDKDGDGSSLRDDNNDEPIGGDFQKLTFDLRRLQLINANNVMLLRLQGQFSDDILSSIEQFSMGGPYSVRAYPVAEYIRDKGFFASAEWIVDAPGFSEKPAFNNRSWGEVLQFSLFVDYANGRSNGPVIADQSIEQDISGIGVGILFKPLADAFVKFEAASPLTAEDASNGDDPQLWLSTGIQF